MKATIAAFDFDGTVTDQDSLLPFLLFCFGYWRTGLLLITQLPWLLGFALGIVSRQRVKEQIIGRFFSGKNLTQVQEWGRQFARKDLQRYVRPAALARIQWHKQQGHRLALVSASLDVYLAPWAADHGFDELICSKPEVDGTGRVSGKLQGDNCWGPEKTRRLLEQIGPKQNYVLYAYGDSRGDKELLELADHGYYRTLE